MNIPLLYQLCKWWTQYM